MIHALGEHLRLLPGAARILSGFRALATTVPDPELRRQALRALADKRFHAWGAAAMVVGVPAARRPGALRAVLAIQTISDYLDNLADRSVPLRLAEVRRLHTALTDAVRPGRLGSYYPARLREDVYLPGLVSIAQEAIGQGGLGPFENGALLALRRYAHLQSLKHLHPRQRREEALVAWQRRRRREPLAWWERAAAAGSTLPAFAAVAGAAGDRTARTWGGEWGQRVAAVHILFDYAIDREEDAAGGDYNISLPGGPPAALGRRLGHHLRLALAERGLAEGPRLVVRGLPALYLTDPKVRSRGGWALVRSALPAAGAAGVALYLLVRLVRSTWLRRWDRLAEEVPELPDEGRPPAGHGVPARSGVVSGNAEVGVVALRDVVEPLAGEGIEARVQIAEGGVPGAFAGSVPEGDEGCPDGGGG